MHYVEFCLKAVRTPTGELSVVDVVVNEVDKATPLHATEVDQNPNARVDSSQISYSICFTVPFADDHLRVATEAAIALGLDPKAIIDVCAKAELVSLDENCPLSSEVIGDELLPAIDQSREYTLVYLEVHRRLSDGKLAIVGMHKTRTNEAVQLSIDDFADLPFSSGKIARGTAYLFRYTSIPTDCWDYRESWNQISLDELYNLLINPLEIWHLSSSAEALWYSDDERILIEVEPTVEAMTAAWASSNRSAISSSSQGERRDV